MLQKIFNTSLVLVFTTLVALYAYKTIRKPHIITKSLSEDTTKQVKQVQKPYNDDFVLKTELNDYIKKYIMDHPDDIVASLETMQQKKLQESTELISSYLEQNKDYIENADSPPVFGNPNGDISIVVFYDYNCSFCKKANEYTNEIISFDPQVKLILRPMPILGGTSMFAAKAALAIQKISPEQFLDIHNAMMQMKLINQETIKELVVKHDIDYNLVDNEINSFSVKQLINRNFEFAKNLHIQGAPSYIINGHFAPGLITVQKFKNIIAQIRNNTDNQHAKTVIQQ